MIRVTQTISIAESEIEERFVRSSGPGGQNVNKVATGVQLRFNAAGSPSLSEPVRRRLAALAGGRMTQEGILIIDARQFRTQEQNRRDALDRFIALLRKAAQPPKRRYATRPSAASRSRRLESKRRKSQTKRTRGPLRRGEDQ
ncbi:MAG: alternative ribosome rescue aminoacyl-tRNA hydrolase ArfB [Candidatus Brocadiia bacterium]|jgi:ribosome-associated protein